MLLLNETFLNQDSWYTIIFNIIFHHMFTLSRRLIIYNNIMIQYDEIVQPLFYTFFIYFIGD